jgi:hypothetical protein
MSEAHLDAVLAGSRDFALALFVPLTERVGIRPRVATDATQALTLLDSPQGLVVVQVEGDGSVRSIRELLATRSDLAVVAAVPEAMAGREEALRALGVELARWDGSPGSVLGAVSRRLGAQAVPPGPDRTGGPQTAPILAPAEPAANAPARASRPAPPAQVSPPAAVMAATNAPVLLDLDAGEDVDVVSIEDLALEEEAPAPPAPAAAPSAPASSPPPASGAVAWPAGGLSLAEAERALANGLRGGFNGESRIRTVTEGVVNTLSALEFAVVSGDPVAVPPEPIRRAALLRLRVASALAERPPTGSVVDQAALSSMLGEIDALLSEVNALAQGAAPDVLPSLEAVRNALVKEAIDFAEAAQQIAPTERVPEAPSAAPTPKRAPAARVLTVTRAPEVRNTRARNLAIVLALAVLAAGGFHGFRYYQRVSRPLPPPPVANAPARATGAATAQGAKFVTSKDGKPFTDAEIETFRQKEELAGRRVELIAPHTMVSLPPGTPGQPAAGPRPAPAPAQHVPPPATPQPSPPQPRPGAAP